MAEKLVLVCDLCGRPAVNVRKMDVCKKHDHAGEAVEPKVVQYQEKPCRFCPYVAGSGAGLSQHVKSAHPKRWRGPGHADKYVRVVAA